ncbi:MAG: class I SAM-dependent methyltransferase [Gracilimonas sp.]
MHRSNKDIQKTTESYNRQAKNYERKWANYLSHTHQRLLDIFDCEAGDRILDVSAGTGLFARKLLETESPFSEMILNDVSDDMLKIARHRFEDHTGIIFSEYPAEKLGFDNQSYDSVISLNALHNYNDQQKALAEICRVLKPGGNFYLLDWNRKGMFSLINYCIDLFSNEVIQTKNADEVRKAVNRLSFEISYVKEWRYSYWNFFLFKIRKK